MHPGLQEDMTPRNFGAIANIGFVVGAKCVAVIDTGGTRHVGEQLRAAVKRATTLPICYVINSHIHPDHIFGNAAFKDDQPTFVGHHKLPAAMAARGRVYTNALARDLGSAAEGSEIVPPTLLVKDALDLDLGGRLLRLKAWPTAHTDNDLTVLDERTGTLWVSDLLFVDRIPVVDGNLRGWLKVIAELKALKPERVVPGHGLVIGNWQDAFRKEECYLTVLLDEVRAAIKAQETIQQSSSSTHRSVPRTPRWSRSPSSPRSRSRQHATYRRSTW